MKNLAYTFEVVLGNLHVCGGILQRHADQGEIVDLSQIILKLTFDIVMESAFDVKLSTQLDPPDAVTEGSQYLHQNDTLLRIVWEGMLNPFKKYYFWSADRAKAATAREYKQRMAGRILQEYRAKHGDEVSYVVLSLVCVTYSYSTICTS